MVGWVSLALSVVAVAISLAAVLLSARANAVADAQSSVSDAQVVVNKATRDAINAVHNEAIARDHALECRLSALTSIRTEIEA